MSEGQPRPVGLAEVADPPDGTDAAAITASLTAPERFAALFDRHAARLHSYVARRLGPGAADDVVAETFLVAFQRRARYDLDHPDAAPWLYGIATNLIRRHRRDEVRLFRAIARTAADTPAEPLADQVTGRLDAAATRGPLARALARLPGGQRDVLLLVASGLTVAETATALQVPLGTVASRLARARRKVRADLGATGPAGSPEE